MDDHPDLCVTCGNPVRPFVTPIPDGAEVSWLEAAGGRPLYCQACFDGLDVATLGPVVHETRAFIERRLTDG